MIYEGNKRNLVAISTPVGESKRVEINYIIAQGESNGPLIAGVNMDKIAKNMSEKYDQQLYQYKNKVKIPCLEMVDDCLNLSKCGNDSVITNAYIVTQIETKKLDLNEEKCHQMHIGCNDNIDFCPQLKTHGEVMIKTDSESYLGFSSENYLEHSLQINGFFS